MRLLLDTHVWLWMIAKPERLTSAARDQLSDPEAQLYLSAVSVWEIVVKEAAGRLHYVGQPRTMIPLHIRRSGVVPLPVTADHALAVSSLPELHRDPFDRLLIAQALADELTLVTADGRMRRYDVPVLDPTA